MPCRMYAVAMAIRIGEHLVNNARADLAEARNVRCPRRYAESRLWYVREEYEAFDDDERSA